MPFGQLPPEERSRAPSNFYCSKQAAAYHSEANETIQKELTQLALSLLPSNAMDLAILDIGCGSGLSTKNLPQQSLGLDVSFDMLQLASAPSSNVHAFVCASAYALPLRPKCFQYAISISMLQWLSSEQMLTFFKELDRVCDGRAVLQVYPRDLSHATEMLHAARSCNKVAILLADFPHPNSALKWFICVEQQQSISSDVVETICKERCPLARRLQGTCSYTFRKARGLELGRLEHEHVQYAWHAIRKIKRNNYILTQTNRNTKPRHKQERKIFPNEIKLAQVLHEYIETNTITLLQLKEISDVVIQTMHQTYRDAEDAV